MLLHVLSKCREVGRRLTWKKGIPKGIGVDMVYILAKGNVRRW